MVVILCEDYLDAEMAFRTWLAFLQTPSSDEISEVDKYSLRVKTNDGQAYVFVDYRFKNVFLEKPGIIFETIGEFLNIYDVEDPDPYRREYRERIKDE